MIKQILHFIEPKSKKDYVGYLQRKSVSSLLIYTLLLMLIKITIEFLVWRTAPLNGCWSITHIMGTIATLFIRRYKFFDFGLFAFYLFQSYEMVNTEQNLLLAPSMVIFSSICYFMYTRRPVLTSIHLLCQVILAKYYIEPYVIKYIANLSPEDYIATMSFTMSATLKSGALRVFYLLCYYKFNEEVLTKLDRLRRELGTKNKELKLQTYKLEEALDERRMFIYTFSHEFKNALNGLLGSLKVAMEKVSDKEVSELLDTANTCAHLLRNFAHNLLDSGKLENQQLEIAPEVTNTHHFFLNLWRLCGEMIKNKKLQGYMRIKKNVPSQLLLDTQKLFQVIMNLTSNSIKFTRSGSISYRIEWEPQTDQSPQPQVRRAISGLSEEEIDPEQIQEENNIYLPQSAPRKKLSDSDSFHLDFKKKSLSYNDLQIVASNSRDARSNAGYLKISVIDTGCGMNDDSTKQLFKKFSQVGETANARKQGTGLGLWITKQLVDLMGGDIKVKTQKGVGTTFEVRIRTQSVESVGELMSAFEPEHLIDTKPVAQKISLISSLNRLSSKDTLASRTKETVLIADDDYFNITLLSTYLKKLGMEVIVAEDGETLINEFKKHHQIINYIITDNNMPFKSGIEAATEIKGLTEKNNTKRIPVYLVTGDDDVYSSKKKRDLGITEVLLKPLDFDKLSKLFVDALVEID